MNRRQAIITAILAAMYQLVPVRSGIAYAVRDGLWSDRNTWKDGLCPSVTDIVFANGFKVVVDRDITAKQLRNDGAHGATDGGQFIVKESRIMRVDGIVYGNSTSPTVLSTGGMLTIGPVKPLIPQPKHFVTAGKLRQQLRTV